MGKKRPLVIHCQYLHRPGAPFVREVVVDEERAVTIIKTNDGRDSTPEDVNRAADFILDYRRALSEAAQKKMSRPTSEKREHGCA